MDGFAHANGLIRHQSGIALQRMGLGGGLLGAILESQRRLANHRGFLFQPLGFTPEAVGQAGQGTRGLRDTAGIARDFRLQPVEFIEERIDDLGNFAGFIPESASRRRVRSRSTCVMR